MPKVQLRTAAILAIIMLVCCAAAHTSFLVSYAQELWHRPHYQFFPFAVGCAILFAWLRWPGFSSLRRGGRLTNGFLTALALALLTVAVLDRSVLFGAIAAFLALVALCHGLGGLSLLRAMLPSLLLVGLVIYPPFNLDRELILGLRRLATQSSSGVLDLLGIAHVVAGNVIETEKGRSLVEDACSGINSLFSVLTCTLVVAFLLRRGWVHTGLLLTSAVGWVLVANIARVVLITWSMATGGLDLTAGFAHEALGVALFLGCLLLVISTDRCLWFLLSPLLPRLAEGYEDDAISSPTESAPALPTYPEGARVGWGWMATPGVGLAYLGLLVVQVGHVRSGEALNLDAALQAAVAPLNEDSLPKGDSRLGGSGYHRFKYEALVRDNGNPMGELSRRWTYQVGAETVILSLDYPFGEWHELDTCYTSQGWLVQDQRAVAQSAGKWVEVDLSRSGGRFATLLYSNFTPRGEIVDPPEQVRDRSFGGRLVQRVQQISLLRARGNTTTGCLAQFQLFTESQSPLRESQRGRLRELFCAGQQAIHQAMSGPAAGGHAP